MGVGVDNDWQAVHACTSAFLSLSLSLTPNLVHTYPLETQEASKEELKTQTTEGREGNTTKRLCVWGCLVLEMYEKVQQPPARYKQTEKIVETHPSGILTHLSFFFGFE